MWALIIRGTVHEITNIDPNGRFHPDFLWVPCDESVKQRMIYEDGKFLEAPDNE